MAAGNAVVLVDVRQPEEFTAPPGHCPVLSTCAPPGHQPGAVNVPLADVASRVNEPGAGGQPIVLVRNTDRHSARTAADLLAAGLRDVTVLRGGTDGWLQRGFSLE